MISGELEIVEGAREAMAYVAAYPELFDYVRHLNGLPKSFGLHSCGKVVATRELDYYLPSCYDANGIRYLQGDMHDVEDVGLVKIDVLGLRTLDAEYDTLEQSGEDRAFLSPKQDYSDPKVLDIFRNGDTVGIFQMASPGMKKTLKKMNIGGIEDISVANALFRPGSLQYIDNYLSEMSDDFKFSDEYHEQQKEVEQDSSTEVRTPPIHKTDGTLTDYGRFLSDHQWIKHIKD